MKKIYKAPTMEVIAMNVTNIIAASMVLNSEQTVNTSEAGVQLGRDNNSSSSIWDQGW